MAEHRIARGAEIAPGSSKAVDVAGVMVMLCNVDGSFYAIEDVCTHDGAPLDQGILEGACIVCPRHGATFDVRTGEALTLPAFLPVCTFPVRADGEDVIIEL